MLLNLVVAILLDEFIATVTRAKEEADRAEAVELEKRKVRGCLDQLTRSLITFEDQHDLQKKIHQLYEHLDEVRSRGLGAEMRARAVGGEAGTSARSPPRARDPLVLLALCDPIIITPRPSASDGRCHSTQQDGSGGLNFEEFKQGVMHLISTISITRDDFDGAGCRALASACPPPCDSRRCE